MKFEFRTFTTLKILMQQFDIINFVKKLKVGQAKIYRPNRCSANLYLTYIGNIHYLHLK